MDQVREISFSDTPAETPATGRLLAKSRRVDVHETGDELYALPPSQFTAARAQWVARAREAGDRRAATELAALRRPTTAAWLVNLLSLRRRALVDDLIALGQQMREAQGRVPPAQLRDLSAERRRLLDALRSHIRALAGEHGVTPTASQLTEAEATLAAAMADDDAARLVRSARLVKPLSYSGFGVLGAEVGAPVARPARRTDTRDDTAARQRLAEAEAALAEAEVAEWEADERVRQLDEEMSRLRELLEAARKQARDAHAARLAAERAVAAARRQLQRRT